MHADLRVLDPIWTTANISAYHGAMIYDTLFGLDANFTPQPQMVGKWGVSDDKLTYTFELRDGLKFSDGAAVTAADCVASVRRWAARSGAGQTHDAAREGHAGRRRQDLPHRAERALWAGDRQPVHDLDLALLHDAQEGRRDRSEPAGARDHRLRPVPLQSRRDAPRQPPRLRPQPELRAARRSRPRPWRAARWSSSIASYSRTSPTSRPR